MPRWGNLPTGPVVSVDRIDLDQANRDVSLVREEADVLALATGDKLLVRFTTTPQAADVAHRGMFYYTEGGVGVADLLYCVMKGADNNYTAIQVAIG